MKDKDSNEIEDDKVNKDEPIDILNASDDDIMDMAEPEDLVEDPDDPIKKEDTDDDAEAIAAKKIEDEEKAEAGDDKTVLDKDDDTLDPEKVAAAAEEAKKKAEAKAKEEDETDPDKIAAAKAKKETEDDKKEVKVDHKSEYEKIFAPFKANGGTMQVRNSDEAITLMQMGANYQKKMSGLKPVLKTVRLLEDNGLMKDPATLNYLIDLHNKKPEAITKLVKESGIDPVTMDVTAENNYVPENRTVSDTDVELDTVLESIKDSRSYSETLNVIAEGWDEKSRDVIANEPNIIAIINGQMEDGTYKVVTEAVNRERVLGNLNGVSDLDAYKQMGNKLEAAHLLPGQKESDATKEKTTDDTILTPAETAASATEKARIAAKKAARPSTPSKKTGVKETSIDPLALSDAEIEKMDIESFTVKD